MPRMTFLPFRTKRFASLWNSPSQETVWRLEIRSSCARHQIFGSVCIHAASTPCGLDLGILLVSLDPLVSSILPSHPEGPPFSPRDALPAHLLSQSSHSASLHLPSSLHPTREALFPQSTQSALSLPRAPWSEPTSYPTRHPPSPEGAPLSPCELRAVRTPSELRAVRTGHVPTSGVVTR